MNCQSFDASPPSKGQTTVPSEELQIVNRLGLHARAANRLAALAAEFPCQIRITRGKRTADAKSIMGLMTLAAGCGSTIRVTAEGERAERALAAIRGLVAEGFGEGVDTPRANNDD